VDSQPSGRGLRSRLTETRRGFPNLVGTGAGGGDLLQATAQAGEVALVDEPPRFVQIVERLGV